MLNLIPPKEKEKLYLKAIFLKIRKICLIAVCFFVILSLILVGAEFLLKRTLKNLEESSLASVINLSGVTNLKEDIIKFNQKLKKAKNIQDEHFNLIKIIEHSNNLVPEEIQITSLVLDFKEETIKIKGVAKNRDRLMEFQNKLREDEVFTDFSYPLASLTERENISFEFEGKIHAYQE